MQKYQINLDEFHQKLEGGVADKITINDIIKIPIKTLIMGIEVEYEHTNNAEIALEIVLDHLFENLPKSLNYYTLLKDMEIQLEN